MEFISATVYRKYLALLAASGLKLPDSLNLNVGAQVKEFTVLHRLEMVGYAAPGSEDYAQKAASATLRITSWAVQTAESLDAGVAASDVLNAELDWATNGYFWVGKIDRIYKDVNMVYDKKLSGYAWCGNTERDLSFTEFYPLKDGPFFTTDVRLTVLEQFAMPTTVSGDSTSKPGKSVGSIDEAGRFTPVASVAVAAGGDGLLLNGTASNIVPVEGSVSVHKSIQGNVVGSVVKRIIESIPGAGNTAAA